MFVEGASDTLVQSEQVTIVRFAAADLPAHKAELRVGAGDMAWVVLEPLGGSEGGPRFTICRIAPTLVVMVEDGDDRRFVTASTIEDAMEAVRTVVDTVRGKRQLH